MDKRIEADPIQGPALTPTAAPVNGYYVPKLPAPELKAVTDLSGISASLAKVGLQQQQLTKEKDVSLIQGLLGQQEPQMEAVVKGINEMKDATAQREASIKASADFVRKNGGDLTKSVWLPVVWAHKAAQITMSNYDNELNSKLKELNTTIGPNGEPVEPTNAEKLKADTWAKYSGSFSLQGFYGSQVSGDLKGKIEKEFDGRAAEALMRAKADAYHVWTIQDGMSSMKTEASLHGGALSPEYKAKLTETLDSSFKKWGINPEMAQPDIAKMIQGTVAFLPQDAARAFLHDVRDVVFGGKKLGDLAGVSLGIDQASDRLDIKIENDARRASMGTAKRTSDEGDAEANFATWRATHKEITAPEDQFLKWSEEVRKNPGFVSKQGDNLALSIENVGLRFKQQSKISSSYQQPGLMDTYRAILTRGEAHSDYPSIVLGSALSEEEKQSLLLDYTKLNDNNALLSTASEYASTIADAERLTGVAYGGLLGASEPQSFLSTAQDLITGYRSAMATFADKQGKGIRTPATLAAVREMAITEGAKLRTNLDALATEMRTSKEAAVAKIEDGILRHSDVSDLIRSSSKWLSPAESERYQAKNSDSADLQKQFFHVFQPGAEVEQLIGRSLAVNFGTEPDVTKENILSDARAIVQGDMAEWLGTKLKTASPSEISMLPMKWEGQLRKVIADTMSQYSKGPDVIVPTTGSQDVTEASKRKTASDQSTKAFTSAAEEFRRGNFEKVADLIGNQMAADPESDQTIVEMAKRVLSQNPKESATFYHTNPGQWRQDYWRDYKNGLAEKATYGTINSAPSWWGKGFKEAAPEDLPAVEVRAQQMLSGMALSGIALKDLETKKLHPPKPSQDWVDSLTKEVKNIDSLLASPSSASYNAPRVQTELQHRRDMLTKLLAGSEALDISKARLPFNARIEGVDTAAQAEAFAKSPGLATVFKFGGFEDNQANRDKWLASYKDMLTVLP